MPINDPADCRRWLAGRLNVERAMGQIIGGSTMPDSEERAELDEGTALTDSGGDEARGRSPNSDPASETAPAPVASRQRGIGAANASAGMVHSETSTIRKDALVPSHGDESTCSCGGGKSCTCGSKMATQAAQVVFALGQLGCDFGTEARRDSIMQHMRQPANPHDATQLLEYLAKNPWEAGEINWTLSLDQTPIYAIQAEGPFGAQVAERLRQFLKEQIEEGVERISVPGRLVGAVRLLTGQPVPVIRPVLRGMYSWTTAALVKAVAGESAGGKGKSGDKAGKVENFLRRIYHELRNLGLTPQERAINYSATNALLISQIFEQSIKDTMELDTIDVERSPICRPDSDCWDVKLTFFDPERVFERARRVYRLTVDVSDRVPVMVGQVRSWSVR